MTMRPLAKRSAFTLVELVLTLGLMAVAVALVAPQLSGFVRGRNVQEEGRRLLALTRYGAEEAISRGERLELWFSPADGKYGLRAEPGSGDASAPSQSFQCADGLELRLSEEALGKDQQARIVFWPDGAMDASSPQTIELLQKGEVARTLRLKSNRLGYTLEGAP